MFDFIWSNKSWLFEGAGVAIIAAIVTFIYRRFSKPANSSHITVQVSSSTSEPKDVATATRVAPLTFQEIVASFKDAPPLQIDAINERFKGITIKWETQIFNMEKWMDDKVRLTLHFGSTKPGIIICDVRLHEYKELAYLKKEAPVTVIGEVERASESSVSLKNAQLFF